MVRNLIKAGFDVTVYTRTKEKAQGSLDDGAHWADSVAACVKDKDAVITMVGNQKDVEELYLGSGGILENAKPGTLFIDSTTSTPDLAAKVAAKASERGFAALDAPVTGGEGRAIAGTLTFMVGGDETAFDRAAPLFDAMGEKRFYQGPAGSGQHCKAANQVAIASAVAGLCEAVAYCEAVGLDPAVAMEAIRSGTAGSAQMNILYQKVLDKDDSPFSYLRHFVKDLKIAMGETESRGWTLPQAKQLMEAYQRLEEKGYGECGIQVLFRDYGEK
jgi:3-hydroxyisobutyrate dehydrogenase/2-hydroxy-3-oxopropionate reductase